MTWTPGDREEPSAQTGPALEAAVAAAGQRAAAGRKALEHLALLLADVGANGDHDLGRAALRALARSPKLVVRLDERTRQMLWYSSDQSTAPLARLVAGLSPPTVNPLAVALASTHGDGRVRERAVLSMLDEPDPDLVPFLVLRTGDWVRQVRDRARAGLALLLADDPATYLPAAMPMALLVDARPRGGFAANQVTAALLSAPPAVRRVVGASGSVAQRRLVVEMEVVQRRLRIDDLVALAESETDVRIRSLAAEAACREAVWTERLPILRRLAGNRRPDVRAIALIGLLRLGERAEVATRLDDSASLVRAIARAAARRVGTDARAHYRAAVTGPAPTPGAVLGFGESVSETDAPLLNRLLTHPVAAIRAAAVRGLRQLDAVETSQVMPLLTDPSPSVVREATTALRPVAATLPAELPWRLLAGARVELRRAGYRLLGREPVPVRLRAALLLAVDRDAGLSRRGRADVTGLVRDASRTTWRRTPLPALDVTSEQHADLLVLARRATPALGEEVSDLLTAWLAGPPVTVRAG
ncbi:hypothetical protein [Micromonospora lupini]|uniref:PBS lyase HEAT domain protein repeat-containing protein n=1 Tax=Micromonospora lupini str. Lupac 08 TaxID=1150864 RepID=I0LAF6_9ACTN|nr:hypothetical protein [Micromonospora lupini]CCH20803.1 conserved hypothetical protein [Micromonospora lupini str. Lupac 08]